MISVEKPSKMPQAPLGKAEGTFITRRDIINYVANKAGGPHFDNKRLEANACLDRIRSAVTFTLPTPEDLHFDFNPRAFITPTDNFVPSLNSIDSVFIELAATCRFLSISPVIKSLKEQLRADLDR